MKFFRFKQQRSKETMLVVMFVLFVCIQFGYTAIEPREEIVSFGEEWQYYDFDASPDTMKWTTYWKTGKAPFVDAESNSDNNTAVNFNGPNTFGFFDQNFFYKESLNRETDKFYSTYYFRKYFNLKNAKEISSLLLEIKFTGGFVVYLNGVELLRRNLDAEISHTDWANPSSYPKYMVEMHEDKAQETFTGLDVSSLQEGANVIAVEVHPWETSDDFEFDMRLAAGSGFHIIKGPYVQNLKKDSITIMWETDLPSSSIVNYGDSIALGNLLEDKSLVTLHEVTLSNLHEDSEYYYSVLSTIDAEKYSDPLLPEMASSGVNSFRTAIAEPQPFRFVVYGDSRSHPDTHLQVINGIRKAKPAFVIHTGDIVSDGSYYAQWTPQYHTPVEELAKSIVLFPAIGNHEDDHVNYYSFFSLPDNEAWYSFDYGNAHFLALNSCYDYSIGSEQYKFAEKDLKESDAKWKFVYFHHPPYSLKPSRLPGNLYVREILNPLFEKYDVDIVFNGHDHYYARMKEMNGVIYIITGGGGAPIYDAINLPFYSIVTEEENHFCIVDIDGDKLSFEAIATDGDDIDKFEIDKSVVEEY